MDPTVDAFLDRAKNWKEEMTLLREILLECDLEEDFKWKHPCYTYQGRNIVLIHGFKEYCALLFFKGVLLKDEAGLLVQQTENVQDARQIRFTGPGEIEVVKASIKAYVREAVDKSHLKIVFKKTREFSVPVEFQKLMDRDTKLKAAFEKLTPGRQRAYLLHFSSAKQSKTRVSRIEKHREKIMEGKGLND